MTANQPAPGCWCSPVPAATCARTRKPSSTRSAATPASSWRSQDITGDPDLTQRYSEQIPVTFVDGRQHDFWRVDPERLRAALARPHAADRTMLFNKPTLDGLAAGTVTATYRRWTAPRAKAGSRFTTRAGVVEVTAVTALSAADEDGLTDADARSAGFAERRGACGSGPTARAPAASTGSSCGWPAPIRGSRSGPPPICPRPTASTRS